MSFVSTLVEDPKMRSNEDGETTSNPALDHPSSPKRKQRVTFKREEVGRNILESSVDSDEKEQTRYWSHPVLIVFETIAMLALLARRLWLLQGIAFVWIAYIAFVVHKWAIYIIRDEDLKRAIQGMNSYFSIAMREAEKCMHGGTARRMMEGGALACRGTAQSFTIRFIRLRNEALLKQSKMEMKTLQQLQQQLEQNRKNWNEVYEKVKRSF
jgi:hypothetical protein